MPRRRRLCRRDLHRHRGRRLCIDGDGDLFGVGPGCLGLDCDDDNDSINPRADEPCDGIDNDCDTIIDDNPIDDLAECGTGLPGQCASGRFACGDGGLLSCVADAAPEAERCDGIDNNCDGDVDEDELGAPLSRSCFDGDPAQQGEGLCRAGVRVCEEGEFGACLGQVLPGVEVCDGLDNDCDGEVDEGLLVTTYFRDNDGDRFGGSAVSVLSCVPPVGYVTRSGDCNDDNDAIFPGATELPGDAIDSNCDGFELCRVDFDGDGFVTAELILDDDGFGDASAEFVEACTAPARHVANRRDCDDTNINISPAAAELIADGVDNNCDGSELCYADFDDDGFRPPTGATVLSADLFCDGFGEARADDPPTDCDDQQPLVNPAQAEVAADGIDQNCDGRELCYVDIDGDGYRAPGGPIATTDLACSGAGLADASSLPGDCNDNDRIELVSPAGTRVLLVNHRGRSGDNFSGTIFDDAAAASITSAAAPLRGAYRPEQALAAFEGEPAAGGWHLEVFDDYAIHNGALRGWSVTIDAVCP